MGSTSNITGNPAGNDSKNQQQRYTNFQSCRRPGGQILGNYDGSIPCGSGSSTATCEEIIEGPEFTMLEAGSSSLPNTSVPSKCSDYQVNYHPKSVACEYSVCAIINPNYPGIFAHWHTRTKAVVLTKTLGPIYSASMPYLNGLGMARASPPIQAFLHTREILPALKKGEAPKVSEGRHRRSIPVNIT